MALQNQGNVQDAQEPASSGKVGALPTDRTVMIGRLGGEAGAELRLIEARSVEELVRQVQPRVETEIDVLQPAVSGAQAVTDRVQVQVRYGRENPASVHDDFQEAALVWKTERLRAEEGASQVERRPFLANRLERQVARSLLLLTEDLRRSGLDQWLTTREGRGALLDHLRDQRAELARLRGEIGTGNDGLADSLHHE